MGTMKGSALKEFTAGIYMRHLRQSRQERPNNSMQRTGGKNEDDGEESGRRAAVGGAHAFVLFVSRAVGLAPVNFARLRSPLKGRPVQWLLRISRPICIGSCLLFTIMVCFSLYGLVRELRTPANMSVRLKSMTARVVGSGDVLAVVVTSAIGIYGAPSRSLRLLRVLELLSQVDQSLGIQLVYAKERNICLTIVASLIAWSCLLVDDFMLYAGRAKATNNQAELFENYIWFYLLYYVVVILEIQFAFMAYSIFLRLKRLNDVLASVGRNLSSVVRVPADATGPPKDRGAAGETFTIRIRPAEMGPKILGNLVDALGNATEGKRIISVEPDERIRRLSDMHGTLCAAAREVDQGFGLPVLIILISTLLHLIVTPYFLILELGGLHRHHYLILQFLWCFAHATRLFMLVEPCHRTKNEALKTGDIVGEMLGHGSTTPGVIRRLELFSRQLLHRTPDFTALGVCSLDRPLIASVTAAVTTYLVILIQFQKQDDMDTEKS